MMHCIAIDLSPSSSESVIVEGHVIGGNLDDAPAFAEVAVPRSIMFGLAVETKVSIVTRFAANWCRSG